jgi:hypothetical protein
MKWLNHRDAVKAKEIVDGLQLQNQANIDIPSMDINSKVKTLRKIGKVENFVDTH